MQVHELLLVHILSDRHVGGPVRRHQPRDVAMGHQASFEEVRVRDLDVRVGVVLGLRPPHHGQVQGGRMQVLHGFFEHNR